MKVRVIAGEFGGRILEGSSTKRTHPMGERVRGAIFNILPSLAGPDLQDAVILDAFAGSGVIGFEALSRGAKAVDFVERDRIAQKIIISNAKLLDLENRIKLYKVPVASWTKKILKQNEIESVDQKLITDKELPKNRLYDYIFADPPYHDPQLSTALDLEGLLKPDGLMVLSYPGKHEVPTKLGIVVVDNRSYGNANLVFYRKRGS